MSTIYIPNLPPTVDEPSLILYFSICGQITKATVKRYQEYTGAMRVRAHITFAAPESVNKACRFIDASLDGFILSIWPKYDYRATVAIQINVTKDELLCGLREVYKNTFHEQELKMWPKKDKGITVVQIAFKSEDAREFFIQNGLRFQKSQPTIKDVRMVPDENVPVQEFVKVRVGGVPRGTTEEDIKKMFKLFGPVKSVEINKQPTTILFATAQGAIKATQFNGSTVHNWPEPITLDKINPAPPLPRHEAEQAIRSFFNPVQRGDPPPAYDSRIVGETLPSAPPLAATVNPEPEMPNQATTSTRRPYKLRVEIPGNMDDAEVLAHFQTLNIPNWQHEPRKRREHFLVLCFASKLDRKDAYDCSPSLNCTQQD